MDLDLSEFSLIPNFKNLTILKADYKIALKTAKEEKINFCLRRGEVVETTKINEREYRVELESSYVSLTISTKVYQEYFLEIDVNKIPNGMDYYPSYEDFLLDISDDLIFWIHDFKQNIVVRTLAVWSNNNHWVLKMVRSSRKNIDSGEEFVAVSSLGYDISNYGKTWAALCKTRP